MALLSFISGFVSCCIDEMQLLSGQYRIATCAITQFMMKLKTETEPKWKLYIGANSVKYVRLLELEVTQNSLNNDLTSEQKSPNQACVNINK